MPARVIHHHGVNFIGYFPSIKMGRLIGWESLLELDCFYILEFLLEVIFYEEQPFRIPYRVGGIPCTYTPDVLVVMRSGRRIVVEIKPSKFVDKSVNKIKFAEAAKWCMKHGYDFIVLTERDIRSGPRLANIKFLTQYARHTVSRDLRERIYVALLSAYTGLTIDSLAAEVSPSDPKGALFAIYHLAFHSEILMDLDAQRISGTTSVWLPFQPAVKEVKATC